MNNKTISTDLTDNALKRIDELEVRTAFLEDTVDSLNSQLAELTQEFILAKEAMRLLSQRLQQIQDGQSDIKEFAEETPPPHY